MCSGMDGASARLMLVRVEVAMWWLFNHYPVNNCSTDLCHLQLHIKYNFSGV